MESEEADTSEGILENDEVEGYSTSWDETTCFWSSTGLEDCLTADAGRTASDSVDGYEMRGTRNEVELGAGSSTCAVRTWAGRK